MGIRLVVVAMRVLLEEAYNQFNAIPPNALTDGYSQGTKGGDLPVEERRFHVFARRNGL